MPGVCSHIQYGFRIDLPVVADPEDIDQSGPQAVVDHIAVNGLDAVFTQRFGMVRQIPDGVPVMTILSADNAVRAVERILYKN